MKGASCCILVLLLANSCVGLKLNYDIARTWDGKPLNVSDIIHFSINESPKMDGVEINIKAPFYDDPAPPGGKPGEAYFGLWNYEVVECFFLSQEVSKEPDYLELEFGPHGQHLGLLLHGVRNAIKHSFPMQYEARIDKDLKMWTGKAIVPHKYFPPHVNKFNAYAINGPEDGRIYKALYPVPGEQPDFHRLEFFLPYDGRFIDGLYSDFWSLALDDPNDDA